MNTPKFKIELKICGKTVAIIDNDFIANRQASQPNFTNTYDWLDMQTILEVTTEDK